MMVICPTDLEEDVTFTFLGGVRGLVKTILITGFKVLGHRFKTRPKGPSSECPSSL